ncbi:MFS transporter [Methanosarcina mazei]|uniref:MFS transporter n=3 Tax=Methanosarcina mazei TaxID=2209 RepID=A0A0F8FT99_METMZ|nr:MFS transporter [Methanosarcina mazei]KKF98980.1 MFS transporter [Methanosarcina mazei]KKG08590.1 MFS transporter [Methanosarcina mazei]KKG13856.1 MFS transporter [Methanosarcina mazei]KKG26632.1 MFS transporter [Methanosarcina mazei]
MERKTVLATLVLAMFILVIDTTIMNVSISALIEEFNTDVATVQAAITLYALVMASFMITGGKIGDIIGRKKAFRIGLVIYGTGSFLTAVSPTMALLFIGWSILEGFGATLVMPAIQTLVTSNYSGKDRALAYGIIGGIVAGAIALGPIIGGWLTTWYTWRLAFAGEVVIVIIVLILSRYILDAPLETEERPKLDIIGTIFSALGVGLIVFGVLLAGVYGWWKARQPYYIGGVEISPLGLSPTPVFIFTGVIILLFFAFWERHVISRGKMPLIRLDVLRDRGVTSGVFTQTVQTLLFGGFLFSMALFFQVALGLNAIQTGFLYLPLSLPLLIASLAASRLSARIAPKIIIQAGLLILIAGLFLSIATINIEVRGPGLMTGFALIGTGGGLIASQVMNLVLSQVLPERTSETAALMSASQNLGMSLGTALMGSIVIAGLVTGATALIDESTVIPEDLKPAVISSVEENAQFLSDEELQAVLKGASPEVSQEILRINENARIEGIKTSLWGLVIFAVVGLIVSIFLPPEILVSKKNEDQAHPDDLRKFDSS